MDVPHPHPPVVTAVRGRASINSHSHSFKLLSHMRCEPYPQDEHDKPPQSTTTLPADDKDDATTIAQRQSWRRSGDGNGNGEGHREGKVDDNGDDDCAGAFTWTEG